MEWELEIKDSEFIPQKRKPTEETVLLIMLKKFRLSR
jgi:hypothetical protein